MTWESNGGVFAPFGLQIGGPLELFNSHNGQPAQVGGIDIGTQHYVVLGTQTDESLLGRDEVYGQRRPATNLALANQQQPSADHNPVNIPGTQLGDSADDVPWNSPDANAAFFRGFGSGMWDTGVSIKDGVVDIAKIAWHNAVYYNLFSIQIRVLTGNGLLIAEDEAKVRAFASVMGSMADLAKRLAEDEDLIYEALILRDADAIEQLGEEYGVYFDIALEVLDAIREELISISPRQAGWITGRVVGEVIIIVAPAIFTAGTSAIAQASVRGAQIVSVIEKVRAATSVAGLAKMSGIGNLDLASRLGARLSPLPAKLGRVLNSRMCFVAGTVVWTSLGPKRIEEVRPGDYVLSRDETGTVQDYQPVYETVVTHPSELFSIWYEGPDGTCSELVCSGEHPFYVMRSRGFIPARDLRVGDKLSLANGATATLGLVTHQIAPANEYYTTYNFEVTNFHTYFAGAQGVWVHNLGVLCQKLGSIFERRLERNNNDVWAAEREMFDQFDAVVSRHPNIARGTVSRLRVHTEARSRHYGGLHTSSGTPPWRHNVHAVQDLSDVDYDDMADQLRENMKRALGVELPTEYFAAHHIVPKRMDIDGHGKALRELLIQHQVHINEAANGMHLRIRESIPSSIDELGGHGLGPLHSSMHTRTYLSALRHRLESIPNPNGDKLRDELQKIATEIADGTFPH